MTGFLYFSAETHSPLQSEPTRRLSLLITNSSPLHVWIACRSWSSQSWRPGCSSRTSTHARYGGGPAASSSARRSAKSAPSSRE